MEFAEVRHYQPGDEVRTIDWNVTARTGVPHVKRYAEERELTVMLLVDASASTRFGSVRQTQERAGRRARRAARLLGDHEQRQGRAGHLHRPHRAGGAAAQGHAPRPARHPRGPVAASRRDAAPTSRRALEHLGRVTQAALRRLRALRLPRSRAAARPLRLAARRHDVIAVVLDDPREATLPDVGLVELEEAETGERYVVDTGERARARGVRRRAPRPRAPSATACCAPATSTPSVSRTDRPYTEALLRFFRMRERRQ